MFTVNICELRIEMDDTKNKKLIDDSFTKVFGKRTAMTWDKPENNYTRIKNYDITADVNSITFYDVPIQFVDKEGKIVSVKTDILQFTYFYKDKPCKNLNCSFHPKIDYGVELFYRADDLERRHLFNLKYMEFMMASPNDWKTLYLMDTRKRLCSCKIIFEGATDVQYLCVFMYISLVKNFFDEKNNEREAKINASNKQNNKSTSSINNPLLDVNKFFGINTNISVTKLNTSTPKNVTVGDPYAELEGLIGLDSIKEDIKQLTSFMKMQQQRKQMGLPKVPVSLHLVFTGNPGTGKTTIARILARIYKDIGVLSKGQMIEVDRASLVAEYVGQTAVKTQNRINEATGGILFIDEAYTLAKGDSRDFGQEAIDTILKAMEDNREDFIVIVAGYPDLMRNFIESNPGLQSRFNKYINFPDYSEDEMLEIFRVMCEKYEYTLDENAESRLKEVIHQIELEKDTNFANARTVRNIFETVITKQATRLADSNVDKEEMTILREEDFV